MTQAPASRIPVRPAARRRPPPCRTKRTKRRRERVLLRGLRAAYTAPIFLMLVSAHPPAQIESANSGPMSDQPANQTIAVLQGLLADIKHGVMTLRFDGPQSGLVLPEWSQSTPIFSATADPISFARAADCLTAAIYYEAASESDAGQRAVAQVVINRVQRPGWPKSVCGVVFQGSERRTGCQFTFTCDGSLDRMPSRRGWLRAHNFAIEALNGRVFNAVRDATNYHAIWIRPYWAATLNNFVTIGAHTFYRPVERASATPARIKFAAQPEPLSYAELSARALADRASYRLPPAANPTMAAELKQSGLPTPTPPHRPEPVIIQALAMSDGKSETAPSGAELATESAPPAVSLRAL